jgi:predicted RNA binding protein YcfA (HicA-like mRNA interferase family)
MSVYRAAPYAQLVVPDHRELDTGTLRAIIRQSGMTVEQFTELL